MLPPDSAAARHWLEKKGGEEWRPQAQRVDIAVAVRTWTDEELARGLIEAQEVLRQLDQQDPW